MCPTRALACDQLDNYAYWANHSHRRVLTCKIGIEVRRWRVCSLPGAHAYELLEERLLLEEADDLAA